MTVQKLSIGAGLALLALVVLAIGGLLAARTVIARAALLVWLRDHGVQATADVQSLGLSDLAVSLSLGDPQRPDLTAPRARVGYSLKGGAIQIRSVRLEDPVLRAQLRGGKLSFGRLDPIVKLLQQAPPRPNAPKPDILIERGMVLLTTDYGPLRIAGDADMRGGRLVRLSVRTAPTRLASPRLTADLGEGAVEVRTAGAGATLSAEAPVVRLTAGAISAEDLRVRLSGEGLYPDLASGRLAGPVAANLRLSFGRASDGGQAVRAGVLTVDYQGQAGGSPQAPQLSGTLASELRAAAAAVAGRLSLSEVSLAARGQVGAADGRVTYDLLARGGARGRASGMPPVTRSDPAQLAALKRAAQDFALQADGVSVRGTGAQPVVAITAPVRLTPARGGAAILAPARGGYRLSVAGGGLPKLDAALSRVSIANGRASARTRLKAAFTAPPVRDAALDVAGLVRLESGGAVFEAERCARVTAARVDLGARALTRVAGEFCPAHAPLVSVRGGRVRLDARARALTATSAADQLQVRDLAGDLALVSARGGMSATLRHGRARLVDTARPPRVEPLQVAAEADLARGAAHAQFTIRDPAGRPLGSGRLSYDLARQRGEARFDTGLIAFAPGGLQPTEVSRLASLVASPVDGRARFEGEAAWRRTGLTSAGRLTVPGLDFKSPFGRVSGLAGEVALTSLLPPRTAPDQTLRAASLQSPLGPLADVSARFRLDGVALHVDEAQGAAFGGTVRLAPADAELTPSGAIHGVLLLDDVQLGELIKASPLADRIRVTAKVDGRLPFEAVGDKVRVTSGWLRAVEPGRLSISRAALTSMSGSGGAAGSASEPQQGSPALTGFAYQALEDLAFTTLDAQVRSEPGGRLRVVFHVVGRHDPPKHQEIRVGILEFLRRKFMQRNLPLPSGTGVDLTLDTSINLDDLVGQYRELTAAPSSAAVQP